MSMNADKMAKDMVREIRKNMKDLDSRAISQPFQLEICRAIAVGTVAVLKKLKGAGAGSSGAIKSGVGIAVDGQLMADIAIAEMKRATDGGGEALEKLMEGFFFPMALRLSSDVEIKSLNGFGGNVAVIGAAPFLFEREITKAFPKEVSANLRRSARGRNFVKAIALGLSAGISSGSPGPIPFGGSTAGPVTAAFR